MRESDIRNSLVKQLEAKKAKTPHFLSLVDDYIFLHNRVQKMKTSIRTKKEEYEAVSAAGKTYMKENPAVKNIILYNRQMLAILKEMGLSTDGVGDGDADGEEDEL